MFFNNKHCLTNELKSASHIVSCSSAWSRRLQSHVLRQGRCRCRSRGRRRCHHTYVTTHDGVLVEHVLVLLSLVLARDDRRDAREHVAPVVMAPVEFPVGDVVTAHVGSDVIVVGGDPEEEQAGEGEESEDGEPREEADEDPTVEDSVLLSLSRRYNQHQHVKLSLFFRSVYFNVLKYLLFLIRLVK